MNKISYWLTISMLAIALIVLIYDHSEWYYISIVGTILGMKIIFPFVRNKTVRMAIDLSIMAVIVFAIITMLIR